MKNFLFVWLLICLSPLLLLCQYIEGATIKINSITLPDTQTSVSIPVELSSRESFAGYQFTLSHNKSILKVVNVRNGNIAPNFSLQRNLNNLGRIIVAGYDPALREISGEGVLVYIDFEVIGKGVSTISFSGVKVSDNKGNNVEVNSINGKITVEGKESLDDVDKKKPVEEIKNQETTIPLSTSRPYVEGTNALPENKGETVKIIRDKRMDRSSPSKTREPSIITPPVSQLTPSATGNFLLFIQSEYGNPTPQKGYTTYKKDENIRCEIEKEIIINEMEKVVCVGYKGNGSISGGNLNKTSFSITQDTTLEWLWQKKLVEKDFVLEFDEQEVEIKDVLNISVKASYYGGLKESIKITIDGLPEFISVSIDKELTYIEREAIITFKKVGDMLAGEYKVIINAQCGNLQKNYELNFISKGKVKKTVIKNKDSVLINLKSVENLELADLFQMKLSFPSDKLTICKILPETVIYKNIDKNIMAFTGDFKGDFISIYFDIKKSFSDILPLKIESLVIRDKNKNKIPISITE